MRSVSFHQFKKYTKKNKERLVTAANNNKDRIMTNRKTTKSRNKKWEEKQLYVYFEQQTGKITCKKTKTWQRNENFKRETESLLIEVRNNAIRTNCIKCKIDNMHQNYEYRSCGGRDRTVNYMISKCSRLAQKEYMTRHNWVGKMIL